MKRFKVSMFATLLWGAVALVTSCGGSSASNGTDSNTHWLKDCDNDSDCGSLSCLCGVCSKPCDSSTDCATLGAGSACELPARCLLSQGAGACVRSPDGGAAGAAGDGAGGTSMTLPDPTCAAQDAHTGSLSCANVVGYAYDGRICAPIYCSCEGTECSEIFDDIRSCDAAHRPCYIESGVDQSCVAHTDCHVVPRTCCASCGVPEPDTLIGANMRLSSLKDSGACIGDPEAGCPECGTRNNPSVSTHCAAGNCEMIDVTAQADCETSDDCRLVSKQCCACPPDARSGFLAMNKNAGLPSLCGSDDCEPCTYEPDQQVGVTCNTELGKCEMVSIPDFGCTPVDCTGLSEAACKQHSATPDSDGCVPRYGAPWPGDPAAPQYAGCAQVCCDGNDQCPGNIDAEVCVANGAGECWMISGPPVPQGWKLLLEDGCGEVPQCND